MTSKPIGVTRRIPKAEGHTEMEPISFLTSTTGNPAIARPPNRPGPGVLTFRFERGVAYPAATGLDKTSKARSVAALRPSTPSF